MNSLSWILYASEVLENFRGLLIGVLVFGIIPIGICAMVWHADEREDAKRWTVRLATIYAIAAFLMVIAPSKNTIYMIAASEAGQAVVQTPEAKEMLGDLREVIAKQIKKLKDDK